MFYNDIKHRIYEREVKMKLGKIENNTYHKSFGTCTRPPSLKDKADFYMRREPLKSAAIGAGTVLLLCLAICKGKSINNFFKNMFKIGSKK